MTDTISRLLGETKDELGRHTTPSFRGRVPADQVKGALSVVRQQGEVPRAVYRDRSGKRRYFKVTDPDGRTRRSGHSSKSNATHADIYARTTRARS